MSLRQCHSGVVYLAGDFPLGYVLILLHLWMGRHRRPYLACCHPVNLHRYFAAGDRDVGIRPIHVKLATQPSGLICVLWFNRTHPFLVGAVANQMVDYTLV